MLLSRVQLLNETLLLGLIASSGSDGSNNDINLIRSLAISYIKKPSCLILLTVACESESSDWPNMKQY